MSFWDNPIVQTPVAKWAMGGYVFEALTGSVWPADLAKIKAETSEGIKVASGGADPAVVKERQKQAEQEIDRYLKGIGAHPDDAELRLGNLGSGTELLKNLEKVVYTLLALGGLGLGAFFLIQFVSVLKATRRK